MGYYNTSSQGSRLVSVLLFGVVLLVTPGAVEAQDLLWAEQAGGISLDLGSNIAVDASGNCYVVGVFEGSATFGTGDDEITLTSTGLSTIFIAKYSSEGRLLWARQTGVDSAPEGWSEIAVDGSGAIYITSPFYETMTLGAGETNETTISSIGSEDFFIAKYTSDGMLLWAKQAGGAERNRGTEIGIDESGHSYVSGFFTGSATFGPDEVNETTLTAAGASDIFVARYDTDGSLVWAVQAGGEGYDSGQGIAVDPSGNHYVMGWFDGSATFGIGEVNETTISAASAVTFLAKYDTEGMFQWVTQSNGSAYGTRVAVDAIGNSYVTGSFEGAATFGPGEANETTLTAVGASDIFVARYDVDGSLAWAKRAGSSGYDMGHGVAVDASGNSYVTGPFEGVATFGLGETNQTVLRSTGNSDVFVASYNSDGTLRGARSAGGVRYDAGGGIAIGPSNGIYVTGRFHESATFGDSEPNETALNSVGVTDVFVAKYEAAFPTTVEEASPLVDDYTLVQNYPNPFSEKTTIAYHLPQATSIRLVIYDLLGRSVEVLVEGFKPPGRHEVVFEAAHMPGGVYFYRLETDSFQQTGQMLLVQ